MSMTLPGALLRHYANQVFVETGTYEGGGVALAIEAGFEEIYSIEVDPDQHCAAARRFAGVRTVHLHLGDSIDVLPRLLASINQRATIWLDAHFTPDAKGASRRTGALPFPLVAELRAIASFSMRRDHIILIDDRAAFKSEFGTDDDAVRSLLLGINAGYRISYEDSTYRKADIVIAELPK